MDTKILEIQRHIETLEKKRGVRSVTELDFIYNEGSTAHRGVWHVTSNLIIEHFDEKVVEHPKRWEDDDADFYRDVHSEHEIAKGDAICGQVDNMRTGGEDVRWSDYSKPPLNGWRTIKYRHRKALYQRGLDNPPSPLCSRCAKKSGVVD